MSNATASIISTDAAANAGEIRFTAKDGRTLTGRLHCPGEAPRIAVVLHGGVGFSARFYQDFAAWFSATHGAAVLTYDYRDFGWSLNRPLAQSDARLSDWAITDQSAALSYLSSRFPALPPRVIGHSLGGQWLAFHEHTGRIDRVAAVASGPGYWRDHPLSMLPRVVGFWWMLGPAAVRIAGYMPGRALGLGADIPRGVYWEWRRLCLKPDYHRSEWGRAYPQPRLEEARFKLTTIPIADDTLIAPHMVRKLPAFYPHAQLGETLLDPARLGLRAIGHAGAFMARNKACWPLIAAPLLD
ncbi:MAG: serine aminopeptidase domain-containing protein [Rhodomicrobium sp.]